MKKNEQNGQIHHFKHCIVISEGILILRLRIVCLSALSLGNKYSLLRCVSGVGEAGASC